MANQVIIPRPQGLFNDAPALKFLPEAPQSMWQSLFSNLREVLFPEKLPPLQLTSKPVAVRDIWERKNPAKAAASSLTLHALAIGALVGATFIVTHSATPVMPVEHVPMLAPPLTAYQPAKTMMGGGAPDQLPESQGRLPKIAKEQFTPPAVVIRNLQPKLAMEASIAAPDVKLPDNPNLPNLGNPLSSRVSGPLSNGAGSGGGIGSGSGGGVGSGVFRAGAMGVSAPQATFAPDPEYSDDALRNKLEGTVTLQAVIGRDGLIKALKVIRPLGMGLDEKAMEKVRTWLFEPGRKDGQAVAVMVNIEVAFHVH